MSRSTDVDLEIQLLRRLAGELPPEDARELDRRLAAEPELAARRRALERRWAALAPPPEPPLPPGITARVMARAMAELMTVRGAALSWTLAPTWVRAAAAVALAAGVALGAGLGYRSPAATSDLPPMAPGIGISPPESLATGYWTAIEEATAAPAPPVAGARP